MTPTIATIQQIKPHVTHPVGFSNLSSVYKYQVLGTFEGNWTMGILSPNSLLQLWFSKIKPNNQNLVYEFFSRNYNLTYLLLDWHVDFTIVVQRSLHPHLFIPRHIIVCTSTRVQVYRQYKWWWEWCWNSVDALGPTNLRGQQIGTKGHGCTSKCRRDEQQHLLLGPNGEGTELHRGRG